MKVHSIVWVPIPEVLSEKKKKDAVMETMKNKNFQWSQCHSLCKYWTSHEVWQFELLSQFLYDTVQEDDIDYPACLTWINNVTVGEDCDLYATRLLFVLTCSKCVQDATLHSLEQFVINNNFTINYVLQLGVKQQIVHLGLGNKNAQDHFAMITSIKQFMDTHHHFPQITDLTMNEGVGMKIAALVYILHLDRTTPFQLICMSSNVQLHWNGFLCFVSLEMPLE